VDPASAHGVPIGLLIEGVRQDHPEWFDEDEDDELEDEDQQDQQPDDRWGQPGTATL
jgi:hypothetical protein